MKEESEKVDLKLNIQPLPTTFRKADVEGQRVDRNGGWRN